MFKKKIILIIICFILLISNVLAVDIWRQNANSDLNLAGGNGFIGYGSNLANTDVNVTNATDYKLCSFVQSDFTPVAYDVNCDGLTEVIVVSGSTISIYTMDCVKFLDLNVGTTVRAMPIIMNVDEDEFQEIYVLTNVDLRAYEYDCDNTSFSIIQQIDYTGDTNDLDYLACFFHPTSETCIATEINDDNVQFFDLFSGTTSQKVNEISSVTAGLKIYNQVDKYSGYATSRTFGNTVFRVPICTIKEGNAPFINAYCVVLDNEGDIQFSYSFETFGNTGLDPILKVDSFFARHGNLMRTFNYIEGRNQGSPTEHVIITSVTDDLGNILFETELFNSDLNNKTFSSWSVADYDKDGSNEACHIVRFQENSNLICYDSLFNVETNITLEGSHNHTDRGLVLADFQANATTLGIGLVDGIYYQINTSHAHNWVATGKSGDGQLITVFSSFGTTPALIYTDDSIGFILRNTQFAGLCGDGICSNLENSFTCPIDCIVEVNITLGLGKPCLSNSNCTSRLCEYGFCALKGGRVNCIDDFECLSGECTANICTKPSIWDSIDASKTQQFGDDGNSNNFIALFFMLSVPLAFIFIGGGSKGSIFAGIVWFYISGFFFAIVGWLSPFILIGMIIVALLIFVMVIMFKGNSD